ncbi:MAG: hypothetical protein WBD09_00535 [Halobacteriota archaeon]
MNTRKIAYALAIVMLCYDSISTLIASVLYGGFADLNPLYNLLGQKSPNYVCILMVIVIVILILAFRTALSGIESPKLSRKSLVIVCDFFVVYLIIIGSIAIPHNTMVLFGSPGIVLSPKLLHVLKVASAVITGIIVIVVNWRSLFTNLNSAKS